MRSIFSGNIDSYYHLPSGDNAMLVEQGRKRNDERDRIDRMDCAPVDELLRVSLSAFDAGLSMLSKHKVDALQCIAEGIAMVQEVERGLRVAAVIGRFTVSGGVGKDGMPMVAVDFADDNDRVTGSRHLSITGAKQLRDAIDRAIGAIGDHAESN